VSLANLGDVRGAIADWLYRTGDTALAARADDFVALFEADFLVDPRMRTAEMEEVDTTVLSGAVVPLPLGYIDMIRLQVLGGTTGAQDQVLEYRTPSQAAVLDNAHFDGGVAKHYTIIAGQIFIVPRRWAPIGAQLEMAYNAFTPLAKATNGTNWLLAKYPNIYLYGSLMQAAAYIDDPETTAKWKLGRDEAMGKLELSERKRKVGAGPLTIRPSTEFRT
jgi:hypothetical protein